MRVATLVSYLKSSLWFVPVLCVLGGAALSFGTIAIDRAYDYEAIPSAIIGGPDAVVAILSTVAASMVSLVALVLTITMVVVQLAMGQFSPRIVQRILRDKPSQFAIGLFVATFVHAILAVREVTNEGDGTGNVPGIAVATALVLVLISIAVLVLYVHHIGRALRVSALIELVGTDTRHLIDRRHPDKQPFPDEEPGSPQVVRAPHSGVITRIGYDELVEVAQRAGARIELVPAMGEFVPADAPLFRVTGTGARVRDEDLTRSVALEEERTLDEDIGYGVRLLVDIAERSLADSPFSDPTTAVQAIDRLHDILRQLARRTLSDGRHRDETGTVRLIVQEMTWDAYVNLAFNEIRMVGAASPQISRRLMAALTDLRSAAPPDRQPVLDLQLERLRAATRRDHADDDDGEMSLEEDGQGFGPIPQSRR